MSDNAEHHDRVVRVRQQLLDLLAGVDSDPMIFPGGLPEDPEQALAAVSLLNADALGGTLACTYLGHYNSYSPQHAKQWLAELLQVLVKTVKRELGPDELNFEHLGALADLMWTFRDDVPDVLPPDIG